MIHTAYFPIGKFSTAHAEAWLRYGLLAPDTNGDPLPHPPAGTLPLTPRRTLLRIDRLKKNHRMVYLA